LPVSSSGHLAVALRLLGYNAKGHLLFDVIVHLGTLAAVLWFYRAWLREYVRIPIDLLRSGEGDVSRPSLVQRCLGSNPVREVFWIVLATVPGISQISRYDMDRWGDYWRFTSLSVRRLFGEVFGDDRVAVAAHGNVLAATAFLHGLADHELTAEELAARDCDYELIITVRAVKAGRRS